MQRSYSVRAITPLFLAIFGLLPAFSQVTGRLSGNITDPSGAAIPQVKVNLLAVASQAAAYTTTSTAEGNFFITSVQPGVYTLTLQADGFVARTEKNVIIEGGRESSLPPIQLTIGSITQSVEVTEQSQGVQTTNAEVSTTVTNNQIRQLPQLNRSPLALLTTQAGVNYNGRTNTTMNGQRVSFSNVTLDGVNIQDNFIRTNALDFLPNLLLLDQVAEMMVATTNVNPALGNGASQVAFISPSGTNQYHGSVYWTNRNNAFAANTWFSNQRGVAAPFLNQNQVGGSLGGRIIKDKLFFYGNYEAFRRRQQSLNQTVIPTPDARNGIFTYRDSGGGVQKANLLTLSGLATDPTTMALIKAIPNGTINDFTVGDSTATLLRNSGGYDFNIRNNRTRDNMLAKFDYILNSKNTFTGTYAWNRDLLDRTDLAYDFSLIPKVKNDNTTPFISAAWRFSPTPTLTNEARGGVNIAPGVFISDEQFPSSLFATAALQGLGGLYSSPVNAFRNQGRYTDTYNVNDNATWVKGRHTIAFGVQYQSIQTRSFNDAGITPVYTLGISGNNPRGLQSAQLPGISASDLTAANNLLAILTGQISSYTQTFNVTSRDSGFVKNATNQRDYRLNYYAGYVQDTWKFMPHVTLSAGVRYDLYMPVQEVNGLLLTPRLTNGNPIQTLLDPNASLDFAGNGDRPLYNTDKNNFAPNLGFAWDVFGDGKMAVRGGYAIAYVNDDTVRVAVGNSAASGLARAASGSGLNATVAGLPSIATPTYKVPLTLADNYALSASGTIGLADPNLKNPYVQQWNLSIQRELKGFVIDARYVGNHGTKLYRSFDLNQADLTGSGFLGDFKKAQQNQALSLSAGKGNNPAFDATVTGSQPLPVFDRLVGGGTLTSATNRTYIQQGQAGTLATAYATARQLGSVPLYKNNQILFANYLTNYSNSTYNAFQIDVTRRYRNGLQLQTNYTFSKALSDASGDGQTRVEPFLDINNAKLEKSRTPFDVTHAFKLNGLYELPFGVGKRWGRGALVSRVIGGWSISSIATWNSGSPFSIISDRGTLNNISTNGIDPSSNNTVNTSLNKGQLNDVVHFYMTGNGPYMVTQNALYTDGRGVAPDGQAQFNGQIFSNPQAGTVGSLQRRIFNGPTSFDLDSGLLKKINVTERQFFEFRAEAINVLNHPSFYIGDINVNSTTFGKIGSTLNSNRVFQFGLQYRF